MGLTTRQVANRLPLSHSTIANYERGKSQPSRDLLSALATLYQRPLDWFSRSGLVLEDVVVRHRRGAVGATVFNRLTASFQRLIEAYVSLERHLDEPLICDLSFDASGKSGAVAAVALRKRLGLDDCSEIPSVTNLLESFGVRCFELPTEKLIEAVAGSYLEKFAFASVASISNARVRMLAARELGHFLFQDHLNGRLDDAAARDRAFEFASYLLLPHDSLTKAFESRSIVQLVASQQRFGLPLSSVMFRARQCGLIDHRIARWMAMEFGRRGWSRSDPADVAPDRATRFERLIEQAVHDQSVRWPQLETITGFSREHLEARRELVLNCAIGGIR